jgi:3-deoxy-7-phosphoheptulonate synthase
VGVDVGHKFALVGKKGYDDCLYYHVFTVMSSFHRESWSPDAWQNLPIVQHPTYPDQAVLQGVKAQLSKMPPLVFAGEVRALKKKLAKVARGEAFLLQGGDCAESFAEFGANKIRDTLRVILQMSVVLAYSSGKPVVKVARMAGQFAKPRSADTETIGDITLPAYRGDIINGMDFTPEARRPDPERMLRCYYQSAATLNLIRALSEGGYANIHKLNRWSLDFVAASPVGHRYQDTIDSITKALSFMEACGLTAEQVPQIEKTTVYTSHEALLLHYEECLTRIDSLTGDWYDTSAHMVWIGDRTRQLDHAHVAFMRGIGNPVGIKCGPTTDPQTLVDIIKTINPDNEEGRIVLISRMGAGKVETHLPTLIRAIEGTGQSVVWSCDPMHGNTHKTSDGTKTRSFDAILQEVREFFAVHKQMGTHAGGVHIEMTGQDVTECVGGGQQLGEDDLKHRYETHCDPRLNASQALELSFLLADVV